MADDDLRELAKKNKGLIDLSETAQEDNPRPRSEFPSEQMEENNGGDLPEEQEPEPVRLHPHPAVLGMSDDRETTFDGETPAGPE